MTLAPDGDLRVLCMPCCCAGRDRLGQVFQDHTHRDFDSAAVCSILWVRLEQAFVTELPRFHVMKQQSTCG